MKCCKISDGEALRFRAVLIASVVKLCSQVARPNIGMGCTLSADLDSKQLVQQESLGGK